MPLKQTVSAVVEANVRELGVPAHVAQERLKTLGGEVLGEQHLVDVGAPGPCGEQTRCFGSRPDRVSSGIGGLEAKRWRRHRPDF